MFIIADKISTKRGFKYRPLGYMEKLLEPTFKFKTVQTLRADKFYLVKAD